MPRMAWFASTFEGLQFWTWASIFSALVVMISSFADWKRIYAMDHDYALRRVGVRDFSRLGP
jgi:hypothetical protein